MVAGCVCRARADWKPLRANWYAQIASNFAYTGVLATEMHHCTSRGKFYMSFGKTACLDRRQGSGRDRMSERVGMKHLPNQGRLSFVRPPHAQKRTNGRCVWGVGGMEGGGGGLVQVVGTSSFMHLLCFGGGVDPGSVLGGVHRVRWQYPP